VVSRLKWCLLWIGGILICSAIGTGLGWVVVVVPKDYKLKRKFTELISTATSQQARCGVWQLFCHHRFFARRSRRQFQRSIPWLSSSITAVSFGQRCDKSSWIVHRKIGKKSSQGRYV